jgi:hypothetical protein
LQQLQGASINIDVAKMQIQDLLSFVEVQPIH